MRSVAAWTALLAAAAVVTVVGCWVPPFEPNTGVFPCDRPSQCVPGFSCIRGQCTDCSAQPSQCAPGACLALTSSCGATECLSDPCLKDGGCAASVARTGEACIQGACRSDGTCVPPGNTLNCASCPDATCDNVTCPTSDKCQAAVCLADGGCAGPPKVCASPPGECFASSGTCAPSTGACNYAVLAGAACSVGRCRSDGGCEGWLGAFRYRRPVSVAFPSPGTDYPVPVALDTATMIGAGHLRADCADLRFALLDGGPALPMWLQGTCNGPATQARVKLPGSWPTQAWLYAYYGDSTAGSTSDISGVHLFADDFSTDPTLGRWSDVYRFNVGPSGEAFWSGSTFVLTSSVNDAGGGATFAFADASWDDGWDVSFRYRAGGGALDGDGLAFGFFHDRNKGAGSFMDLNSNGYTVELDAYLNAQDPSAHHFAIVDQRDSGVVHLDHLDTPAVNDNAWHQVEVRWYQGSVQALLDGWCCLQASGLTNKTFNRFNFGGATGGSTDLHEIDDVRLRRHMNPEPTTTVGPEESVLQ